MKKINWDLPMSRKDYGITCGVGCGLAMAIYAISMGLIYWDEIKVWTAEKIKRIKRIKIKQLW